MREKKAAKNCIRNFSSDQGESTTSSSCKSRIPCLDVRMTVFDFGGVQWNRRLGYSDTPANLKAKRPAQVFKAFLTRAGAASDSKAETEMSL